MTREERYRIYCLEREATHQRRVLVASQPAAEGLIERDEARLMNFGSNDYLGLSQHPLLIARAQDFVARYGAGATASRLVTGNLALYSPLETALALGKGTEAAIILSSGYQANLSVLAALADPAVLQTPVTILADRLCHNSLLQGALLSGARLIRFHHNDMGHLETLLKQHKNSDRSIFIVSESVFGMDGDCADLERLTALSSAYDAMLYIDEAHATGVYGASGFGLCAAYRGRVDVVMGTFGKALGSFGAYIACSAVVRDYLIQRCGGLIYSTALPPAVLGAIDAALELLPTLNEARAHLHRESERVRQALRSQGWNCGLSQTQIIPVLLGQEETATHLATKLRTDNIFVPAIRPPTVPQGMSRLRISLSAVHTSAMLDELIGTMQKNISLNATAA